MSDPCRQTAIRSLLTSAATHVVILEHLGASTPEVPMDLMKGALQMLGVSQDELREASEVLALSYLFDVSVGGPS